ncbi:MAG: hypothetical protein R2767_01640 [Chitinophagales bacterium]|nr:hypothetical protein [Chitinophagales bacterium]HPE98830.1 hypothetical protein [Chitinophagales bacterium]HQU40456.1 hypothetical protein [Chitinophagales bacterium]HQU76756.1 hypothetical protein [Chitinophagales bacterium]HRX24936.1 hypothetical protein [Chitinophagales bacterium]
MFSLIFQVFQVMLEFPTIQIGGLTIHEPMTAFTDVILTIISFVLVGRIRNRLHESFYNNAWRLFFLFMGLSTGLGVLTHGLVSLFSAWEHYLLWMAMNVAASISVYFALQATIRYSRVSIRNRRLLKRINLSVLVFFLGLTFWQNNFEIFKIHAATGVLIIFLTYFTAWTRNLVGSGAIVLAFLLSIATVFVHSFQLSINEWFNYKDLSHVMMMVSLLLVYHGMQLSSRDLKLNWRRAIR